MIKEEHGTLFAYKSWEKHMQHLLICQPANQSYSLVAYFGNIAA